MSAAALTNKRTEKRVNHAPTVIACQANSAIPRITRLARRITARTLAMSLERYGRCWGVQFYRGFDRVLYSLFRVGTRLIATLSLGQRIFIHRTIFHDN